MADGINRVQLLGNLGSDPELRLGQSGNAMLKMSLATSKSWKDRNGERQQETQWHRLVLWGSRAEILAGMLQKGDRIWVEGEIVYGSYESEGVTRYTTDIRVHQLSFQNPPRQDQGGQRRQQQGSRSGGYGRQRESGGRRQEQSGRGTHGRDEELSFNYGANKGQSQSQQTDDYGAPEDDNDDFSWEGES